MDTKDTIRPSPTEVNFSSFVSCWKAAGYSGKTRYQYDTSTVRLEKNNKINQVKFLEILTRFSVPDTLLRTIRHIYIGAKFRGVRGKNRSSYKTQDSGVRPGCLLFPYLFNIIMSAVFHKI